MEFKSKQKREMIADFFIGLIPEAIIAAIASALSNSDERIPVFFITFFGLHAAYFAIWVKKSIWDWIVFKIKKQAGADDLYRYLKENKFPKPESPLDSSLEYFKNVADDEGQPMKIRLLAAEMRGVYVGMSTAALIQQGLRISIIGEMALTKYRDSFPEVSS